jgi:ribosomal protein S18 acetylase RimI-like enzyme
MAEQQALEVRRATEADLEVIVPLFDAYRQFYGQSHDLETARQFLSERLHRNESVILLATIQNGQPAGFTQLYPSFSSASARRLWILNDLFVTPEFRRCGVGTALLSAAAAFGVQTGAVRLMLSTAGTNQTAQRLYESRGWTRDLVFYTYTLPLPCESQS